MGRRPLGFRLALGLFAFLILCLAVPARAAAPAQNPDVKAGQALYVTHCAACHGDSGRGDGPSAAGFATKPADLTDGRLLNALPHRAPSARSVMTSDRDDGDLMVIAQGSSGRGRRHVTVRWLGGDVEW